MPANVIEAAGSLDRVQNFLLSDADGFSLNSISLAGTLDAVGVFDSLQLSSDLAFSRGVLLTSGSGVPGRTNSDDGFSVVNGEDGDADLTAFAKAAFSGSGETEDATVLTLEFFVDDPAIKTLSFDIAFGSDEYPEFSNSSFVDIGAIWTGTGATAKNYALINGDPTTPLAVIDENVSLGNFIDNRAGDLAIEYDGIVNRQTVLVPVVQGLNVIRIGTADTGDSILDSGIFILGVSGSGSDVGGTFQEISVTAGGEYDAGGENFIFTGDADDFFQTLITDFDDLDQISIENASLSANQVRLSVGSLGLRLDVDGDGLVDGVITLDDPVINATVNVSAGPDGTAITLTALAQATGGADVIAGGEGLDYIAGGAGADMLRGLGGSDALSGGDGDDRLDGGAGADWLTGGKGRDIVSGGAGSDVFSFDMRSGGTGDDRITDFGSDDLLVTTARIRDSNKDGVIGFGSNKLLDLAGGGRVQITSDTGARVLGLEYDGGYVENGVEYFVYSAIGSSVGVADIAG